MESTDADSSYDYEDSLKKRIEDLEKDLEDTDDPDEIEELEDEIDRLKKLLNGSDKTIEVNISQYKKAALYFYTLVGACDTQAEAQQHKTCTDACYPSVSGLETCLKKCNTTHACLTGGIIGSGVLESTQTALTNHHVVRYMLGIIERSGIWVYGIGPTPIVVKNYHGGTAHVSDIKWYDDEDDIAFVGLDHTLSDTFIPPKGALADLKELDPLFTIGNPNGVNFTFSKGHVTNLNPGTMIYSIYACDDCITYSLPSGTGNSGGGVFDHDGKLIGLLAFGVETHDNLTGGPHIKRIKHLFSQSSPTGDVSELSDRNYHILNEYSDKELANLEEEIIEIVLDNPLDQSILQLEELY